MQKALYSKYRPQKFSDVIGQEHITKVLAESLKLGNLNHAYLFSGGRGIGKTSVARILASEIGTSQNDLYEIDAASNTGVDHIRDINESVNTLPFDSKYKVYILDEVHMLSKSAFNALLKTLEEPPSHVVFVLATTEPEKIPETVISRCEVYNFKTPNEATLKKMILKTAQAEGYELLDEVANLIALLGDGSFRDSHTILQKVIRSSADKKLTIDEVEKVTGAPKSVLVSNLIEAVRVQDPEKVIAGASKIEEENLDIKIFYKMFLQKFREEILNKVKGDSGGAGQAASAEVFSSKNLLRLLEAAPLIFKSSMPYVVFETILVEICEG